MPCESRTLVPQLSEWKPLIEWILLTALPRHTLLLWSATCTEHRVYIHRGSTLTKTAYRIWNWLSSGTGWLCSQPPAFSSSGWRTTGKSGCACSSHSALYCSASQSGVPWNPKSGTKVLSTCIFEQLQLGKKYQSNTLWNTAVLHFCCTIWNTLSYEKSEYYNMHVLIVCYLKSDRYMFFLVYLYDSCVGKYTGKVSIRSI